jgi:pimeloyl-ACP methyl ester carboxylesterase
MPATVYRSAEDEAHIGALYDEALAALGADYESLTVGTRLGDTHVLAVGPEGTPPALILPGGNFLNPTCLRWFLPLTGEHRLYAPDLVGQPDFSARERSFPSGDGHAFWVENLLEGGLGLGRVPVVGLSYEAGVAIRAMGHAPERVSWAALVSPAAVAAGPVSRMLYEVAVPMLLYRLRPTRERLLRAAKPILTEPEDLAVRQRGAIYRRVRLDPSLPRTATEEELEGFEGPVAVFAPEHDLFFPARAVLERGRTSSPTSSTPNA